MIRTRLVQILGCASLVSALACSSLMATGEVIRLQPGSQGEVVTRVSVSRTSNPAPAPRLVAVSGTDVQTFLGRQRTHIEVRQRGNVGALRERYHYLVFGTPRGLFERGTADSPSIVHDHIGQLTHLTASQGSPNLDSFDAGGLHVGASWIAVVQDDDRTVPWLVTPGDPRCFPMPGNDCFDVRTVSLQLFETIADRVEPAVAQLGARVARSALHGVPQIVHRELATSGAFRRARGFGFIYQVDIVHTAGPIQVFVPIHFVFADDVRDYRLFIDPVALGRHASETMPGVLVKGLAFTSLIETQIRERVITALGDVVLPSPAGTPFESFVMSAINAVAGPTPHPGPSQTVFPSYEVILIPESVDPTARPSTIWERKSGAAVVELRPMKIVFLE